ASLKEAQRKIEQLQAKSAATQAEELSESAQEVAGVKLVTSKVATANPQVMSALADSIADRLRSVVVVLGGVSDGKVLFVGKVTPDLVQKGLHAGNLLREVAKVAGGGGGGRPEFAQAGGKNPEKVDEALEKAAELVTASRSVVRLLRLLTAVDKRKYACPRLLYCTSSMLRERRV
ncbi:MAG TPA: DHHA1 domain-containing protein, partial [Armatimonadota bacterium]|nr:DHHA1 domain-containing protein [Armatimonadota bacterium]